MELFSLLAKLTLDSKEYDKGIDEAEKKGNFTIEDAKLGLDKSDFDSGVSEAENTQVSDPEEPELGLDTTEFEENIEKAEKDSSTYTSSIGKMFGDLKNIIVGAGIVGVLGSVNSFLKEGINLASEHADTIDKDSGKLGISYEYYQKLDYMLDRSGGTVNELKNGFIVFRKVLGASDKDIQAIVDSGGDLTDELQETAEKSTEAEQALKDFLTSRGYDISGFNSVEEMMDKTFHLLAQITDKSERDDLIDAIFGARRGGVVKNLVKSGEEALDELAKYPVKNGLIMTDEEIANGVKYKDTVADFHAQMNALKEVFVADILPVLTDALKFITSILAFFNPRADKNGLADMLEDVDKDFANNIRNIDTMEGEAMSLVDRMAKMGEYSSLSAEGQAKWNEMADKAIGLFPQLSDVIDKDSHKLKANTDEIKKNIKQYGNMLKQRALDQAVADKNQILADKAAEAADKELEAETKINEAEGKRYAAIAEANRLLQMDQNASLAAQFYAKYGENALVTAETLDDFNTMAEENYNGTSIAFSEMLRDYDLLLSDADRLKKDAEKANAEVEKEREHLERYTQIASEKYGILMDDTDAISSKTETAAEKVRSLVTELNNVPKRVIVDFAFTGDTQIPFGSGNGMKMYTQAIGDPYVPYDNYPSLLHRGEMVLPATEARKYREGDSVSTDLEDRIIEAIQRGMSNAHVDAYMDGEKVTRSVSTRLARENGARRYNP